MPKVKRLALGVRVLPAASLFHRIEFVKVGTAPKSSYTAPPSNCARLAEKVQLVIAGDDSKL